MRATIASKSFLVLAATLAVALTSLPAFAQNRSGTVRRGNAAPTEKKPNIDRLASEGVAFGVGDGRTQTASATPRQSGGTTTVSVIESRVDGEFEGWDGDTVVKLMNGQIWLQTDYYYHYHYAYMPTVLVYKSGSGYKMQVEGVGKAVAVRQLR